MAATERIDKYLSGQMDADERAAFEAELRSDTDLAEELELQKDMNRFLERRQKRDALIGELDSLGQEFFSQQTNSGRVVSLVGRRRWALAVAATVILLVVAWFALRPSLYDQYAQHPPLALVTKSGESELDLATAEKEFNSGAYQKALPILQEYVVNHPEDNLVKIYFGIAKMETGAVNEAREIFTSLATSESPEIKDFAVWNLALSYLKDGDKAGCAQVLAAVGAESTYYEKAQQLLNKLGK